ncbi:MAG TPA: hypothetical protein VNO33_10450, partial [Kofleriaceae bacterium]|nr:hypothetical protein [Kofleriaceae bacterium]
GNCAKACPWDNIQMAPRDPAPGLSLEVAVKCDLCRGYEAPACVEACPTDAIMRLDPARDFAEVAGVLGIRSGAGSGTGTGSVAALPEVRGLRSEALRGSLIAAAGVIAFGGGAMGWARQQAGAWSSGQGAGLICGLVAGVLVFALLGYAAPKRLVRRWMRRRPAGAVRAAVPLEERPPPRSRTRPHLIAHVALGLLAPACVVGHAGLRLPASPAGALMLALALASLLGVAGAIAYRALPARLTRLERRGALPEDLAGERDQLFSRLYSEISGTGDLVKAVSARLLLPYARAPLGWLALAASGRSLTEEERRLRARVDLALAGRGRDRLHGLDPILRTAVELRALPARRALTTALRVWLPLHIVAGAAVLALLLVHAVTALLP